MSVPPINLQVLGLKVGIGSMIVYRPGKTFKSREIRDVGGSKKLFVKI
jgi:hypothetical protein